MPSATSFIPFDVETGGFDATKNAVSEIAAVAFKGDTLEKIDLVSTYIKPYGSYTYEESALKATGISMADIEGGVDVKVAVDMLIELFEKADIYRKKDTKPILIAHNGLFDSAFLIQLFTFTKKMKFLEKLVYGRNDYYGNFQPYILDTIPVAKLAWSHDEDMANFKLASCVTKAGVDLSDAHLAINDTIAMGDMVKVLTGRMRNEGEAGEVSKSGRYRDHFQF